MSNEELEDYFELLATNLKAIQHTPDNPRYCRFDIQEVLTGLRHSLDLSRCCLLLEAPAGALEDNTGDGYYDNQDIAFMVLRQCEERNFQQEKEAQGEGRRVGLKVLARILADGLFCDLDENTVDYEKVGPVFGNCFGYRYSFVASNPIDLTVDPADWNE